MALTRPKYSNIVDTDYKASCRIVTTTDITLGGGAPNIYDGVSLAIGNRILVAGQSTASQNGIYVVQTVGTGSNGTWVRSFDANDGTRLTAGMQTAISEGTYAGKRWQLNTPDPITVGITGLTFVEGSGTPGGFDKEIQFNNSNVLGGASGLKYIVANGAVISTGNIESNASINSSSLYVDQLIWSSNGIAVITDVSDPAEYLGNILITAAGDNLIDTLPLSGNTMVRWTVTSRDITNSRFRSGVIDSINDGSSVYYNEYGIIKSNPAFNVVTFSSNISGGNVNLYASRDGGTTTVTYHRMVLGSSTRTGYPNQRFAIGPKGEITGTTGIINTSNTTAATSAITGALQVAGGAGIGGNLYTGGNAVIGQNLTVSGNLTVQGTTTTLNTDTLDVEDLNITIAKGAINAAAANNAGITVDGASATILYTSATDSWNFNKGIIATSGSLTGITGAASTFVSTNFSSGNAVLTGGSITGGTGAFTTLQVNNLSSGNIFLSGAGGIGYTQANAVSRVGNVYSTYGNFTNLSSGNAILAGGSVTGGTGAFTTLQASNFSSANIFITAQGSIGVDSSGAVSRIANVYAGLGNFTNLSSGNVVLTGQLIGIDNLIVNTSSAGAAEGGQIVLAWKGITNLTGQGNSSWNIDVNADNNLRIFYQDAGGGTGIPLTISQPGQIVTIPNLFSSNVSLGAGTASVPPLDFTTGTLTTNAQAGAVEYDGRVFYKTTQGTERGLNPAAQYYVLNADRGLATLTTTQTLFNQTFKVSSNTRYYYEAFISISKTNATANTLQYAVVLGGTPAVLAAHEYSVSTKWAAARTTVTALNQMSNRITTGFNTLVAVSGASAAAAATVDAIIQGFFDVTTGGTIDPQIALATNSPTAPTLLAQSYWLMYPVGPISANTSIQ